MLLDFIGFDFDLRGAVAMFVAFVRQGRLFISGLRAGIGRAAFDGANVDGFGLNRRAGLAFASLLSIQSAGGEAKEDTGRHSQLDELVYHGTPLCLGVCCLEPKCL